MSYYADRTKKNLSVGRRKWIWVECENEDENDAMMPYATMGWIIKKYFSKKKSWVGFLWNLTIMKNFLRNTKYLIWKWPVLLHFFKKKSAHCKVPNWSEAKIDSQCTIHTAIWRQRGGFRPQWPLSFRNLFLNLLNILPIFWISHTHYVCYLQLEI